jgi:hypothetical protein
MSKAKAKAKTNGAKRSRVNGKSRKPVDLQVVRQEINDMVGGEAISMVETTIAEVDKGHYGAMKYLFEMIGLYPATEGETPAEGEDVLAKTLLKRLGLPEDAAPKPAVTKGSSSPEAENDAVE